MFGVLPVVLIMLINGTGKSNHTGVLSKNQLHKAYNEWLLPLRTLVTGIASENRDDYEKFVVDMVCALNPVELVLYRCIELVEEKMKERGIWFMSLFVGKSPHEMPKWAAYWCIINWKNGGRDMKKKFVLSFFFLKFC